MKTVLCHERDIEQNVLTQFVVTFSVAPSTLSPALSLGSARFLAALLTSSGPQSSLGDNAPNSGTCWFLFALENNGFTYPYPFGHLIFFDPCQRWPCWNNLGSLRIHAIFENQKTRPCRSLPAHDLILTFTVITLFPPESFLSENEGKVNVMHNTSTYD